MPDRRAALVRYASLLCWIAYFVVPTDAGGPVGGLPIGPLETVALLTLAWLAMRGEGPRHGWIAALILVVAGVSGAAIPGTGGFRARYFANAAATGPHERSTEYRNQAFTRNDARLDFAPGGPEFPLAFVNDISRFNFYIPGQPRRRQLEFAAAWNGQWWTAAGDTTLYLEAPESTAQLFIDGTAVASVTPASGAVEVTRPLTAGWHRLDATFSSPYGAPRRFSTGQIRGGSREPFDATSVVTQRVGPWQLTASELLRWGKTVADGLILAWLGWLFALALRRHLSTWRNRSALGLRAWLFPLLAIAVAAEAVIFAWPWSQRLMVMAGGDDPMTYEWYSRDILFNGILMNFGLPAGQGEPFYYQAFYPYFLAAVHTVFGEGMFGVILVQRLLVAFTVWAIVEIAVAIGGEHRWPGALACGMVFAIWKQSRISADLLNESLYVPLLVAWVVVLLRVGRSPSTRGVFGAAVLGGVAAMTRSTVLLAWPAVWLACWRSWRTAASWQIPLAVLALCSVLTFSLIGARNWIVSGRWVTTSSELGVTLLGGNELPPDLVINPSERASLYQRLGFNDYTVQVVEYAITAPSRFARHQGRKALFVLGFYEPYAPGWGASPIYIAGWMLAVAGLVVAGRSSAAPLSTVILPGVIAASQFMALVVVYPKAERLILPIYALLAPYAGIAVAAAAGAARRQLGR